VSEHTIIGQSLQVYPDVCRGESVLSIVLLLTETMPIEELLKRYAGYGSDDLVSDEANEATAKISLRSSSRHRGCM